ncbi:hypothetical protein EDEG_01279 [Edhazardia aedis USNM 41457]|uniref:lysine--tRNA ligase n=1 Tax=Edhazardia aedis (strain USNM 41457) TaxID=1003232 RepID=J9D9S2_EDHAE|nr:hypothetical protein EDEG_01279 [Edhazardia aedis USNM 41457]|eukprot:EJW04511.1 hypothetical protein EDEG_01279 [Edhazardia aedis USNM 41457]
MQKQSEDDFYLKRAERISGMVDYTTTNYPHKFHLTHTIEAIQKKYDYIEKNMKVEESVSTVGRIMAIRKFGQLSFYKVCDNGFTIQMVIQRAKINELENKIDNMNLDGKNDSKNKENDVNVNNDKRNIGSDGNRYSYDVSSFADAVEWFKRGDIIGFCGLPGRTKNGELSVFASSATMLSPCLRTLPMEHFGIKEPELIYRKRYLDLILSTDSKARFLIRSKVINYIRNFLNERDFLEVETPMMNLIPGGAAAKPFVTFHNELKLDLFMRISPELYLKQLVIGGLNRVYELGKNFRNEGIDLTHNPEFTACEFYMAYADCTDLIEITEDLLNGMVKSISQTEKISYWPPKRESRPDPIELDFSKPFQKIEIIPELNKQIKNRIKMWTNHFAKNLSGLIPQEKVEKFESPVFLSNFNLLPSNLEEMQDFLLYFIKREDIKSSQPFTLPRILDKLIGEFIEPQCTNPTFLTNHPLVMSPLAKKHRDDPFVTERFELFINGKEICNAYTELNDPFDQQKRFEEQVKDSEKGDDEAMKMDKGFVTALEYGLPPTAGWGIGIDRLVMFLANAANIRDVILFPAMKPEDHEVGK